MRSNDQPLDGSMMRTALAALGAQYAPGGELVIVGGAAAVLCHWLTRVTGDIDVVAAVPRLAEMQAAVEHVAADLGLSEKWLNDAAKGFAEALPSDFRTRVSLVDRFHDLRVYAISRQDFILLKLYAFRETDFEDLRTLKPTKKELTFVRSELPRLARFDPGKAHLMELYLDQEEATRDD